MRAHLLRAAAIAIGCLASVAPAAQAGLSSWTSLFGLTANDNASWIRVYATGSPPTTIYAGTEGDGVFKSTNDGLSWSPMSSGLEYDGVTSGMSIRALFTAGGKIYAGTDGGLFSAPDTTSSGGSWTPVAQGPEQDPKHPKNLNAAVQAVISLTGGPMLAGVASGGVYRSTDDGKTWTPPADSNGMTHSTTVWSLTSFSSFVWAATSDGIYRSTDSGATWTLSSDGIPFTTTLGVFQDSQNPAIYYAETVGDGLYRSIDGATTWQSVNGDPGSNSQFGGGSTPTIHGIVELSGQTQTRLYTATSDGLWVGTLPNVSIPKVGKSIEVPGQVVWRRVTQSGLGSNTIFWALSSFTTVPGTLLAGTQSNGGYSLTFEPPTNSGSAQDRPTWPPGPLKVGAALVGSPGNWHGTPQIDYSYQWQRCTTTQGSSCSDIDKAGDQLYELTQSDQGHYVRLKVTATNDFPLPSQVASAYSDVRGPVGAKPGPLPGDNQSSAPAIVDINGADPALPTEGDTLKAPDQSENPSGYLFNPAAANVSYKWLRCDANGDNCVEIPGATNQTYVLTATDDHQTLRVRVTGSNQFGAKTLADSAQTNQIIALPANNTSPPTLTGHAYVGATLIGGVGSWASPATYWSRQWEQCQPDGSACSPIQGETSPSYKVRPDDVGMRIRLAVTASVVPPNHLPLPVEADTPVSAIITYPPTQKPPPQKPPPPPTLGKLGVAHHGQQTTLSLTVAGPGKLIIVLERLTRGHRVKKNCAAGKRKHKPSCTLIKPILTITKPAAGKVGVPLPKHLPKGSYRIVVTPVSPTGKHGAPKSVDFKQP